MARNPSILGDLYQQDLNTDPTGVLKKFYIGYLLSLANKVAHPLKGCFSKVCNVSNNFLTIRLIKLWKHPYRISRTSLDP